MRRAGLGCFERGRVGCRTMRGQLANTVELQLNCNTRDETSMTLSNLYSLPTHCSLLKLRSLEGLLGLFRCIIEGTSVENAVFIDNPPQTRPFRIHLHDSIIDHGLWFKEMDWIQFQYFLIWTYACTPQWAKVERRSKLPKSNQIK